MATREQILGILVGESGPINQAMMSEKLGEQISSFSSQLGRLVGQGLVQKNEQKEFSITEEGRAFALREAEVREAAGVGGPDDGLPPTEESLKTTEYQTFIEYGKITGVSPLPLIGQTANHIWRGGDFRDMTWVWKGLTEMGIRPDLAQRWFHSWRSYLHQALPAGLASIMGPLAGLTDKQLEEQTAGGKEGIAAKGKRDYIIDGNNNPLYVGEGLGDLDYEDAVKLATVRAAAIARGGAPPAPGGQPATVGTMADDMTKVFNAVKAFSGPQSKEKSYIVKPGEEGYIVEEVEEGKPTLISTPVKGNINPSPGFLIDNEGTVTELEAGKPTVIIKQAPPAPSSPGKTYLVRQTPEGMVTEEFDVGKPIIINAPPPGANLPPMLPFPVIGNDGEPVYDKDGKPVYANIEPMMKWMGFQSEQRRADERHQQLMGLAKTVRENLGDGVAALKAAASEIKGGTKAPAAEQPQLYECGQCHEKFGVPPGDWPKVACPSCHTEYTREEVLGV